MSSIEGDGEALEVWDSEPVAALESRWEVAALRVLKRTASTNDVAREWANQGASVWSAVVTEEQTAGRGRNRKPWTSVPGASIALSVLAPALGPEDALPLRAGLSVAEAIEQVAPGLQPTLKWPNDVLLDGRKVSGILCETAPNGCVVVGIGINVSQTKAEFPASLRDTSTSLALALAEEAPVPRRSQVVAVVLSRLRARWEDVQGDWLGAWATRDALRGREVECSSGPAGQAMGCDVRGALLVRATSGQVLSVVSGSVQLIDDPVEA